jgi:hypothetical protein
MRSDLQSLLEGTQLRFVPVAQSSLTTFLIGVYNPVHDLYPSWGYIANQNGVIITPVPIVEETLIRRTRPWGPVVSSRIAQVVTAEVRQWAETFFENDDDDEDEDSYGDFD